LSGINLHRLLNSLRFQIGAAFLALLVLFAAACLTTLAAFQRQLDADAVVEIAARLELASNQMHMQAMNYDAHAPRDYPTYYRDVNLYFRDLSAQIELFDAVVMGFMSGDFSAVLERPASWMQPARNPRLNKAVEALESAWTKHRAGLLSALGDDPEEPRLEWAAEFSIDEIAPLEEATAVLSTRLREWAEGEHARLRLLALVLLGGSGAVAVSLLLALQLLTLNPLKRTLSAVQRTTEVDFGAQIPVAGATEIRDLSSGFNALSARLQVLFQLTERLQRGNDLDEIIHFLGRDYRELLRFDWIGVVLISPDNTAARLEASALDGSPESSSRPLFPLSGTLLERALGSGRPMHIRAVPAEAATNPAYAFLRDIARRGMSDAVFLPVAVESATPVLVAFAARRPGAYDEAHLRFSEQYRAADDGQLRQDRPLRRTQPAGGPRRVRIRHRPRAANPALDGVARR
jgi:HAMP domain-containing protein